MDALHLKNCLEKIIAILPGSRDRHGGPIIIFLSHGELVEYPFSEVTSILSYLAQIPEEKCRSKGFTVMIDMRQSWVKYMKTMIKATQHVLNGRIRQLIIVKPDQFLEKQKINLELRMETHSFLINVVSVEKLSKFVDLNQMPFSFFGTYPYDHTQWIDLRLKYEDFIREGSQILRRLEYQLDSKPEINKQPHMTDNVERTGSLLQADDICKKEKLIGNQLADELRGCADHTKIVCSWPNLDHLLAASRIDVLCQEIKSIGDQIRGRSVEQMKLDKERSDQIVFEQFLVGFGNVSEWLTGAGSRWLQSLREIGESKDEADQIKREHDNLELKVQEVIDQVTDLKSMANELLLSNNYAKNAEVLKKRDFIDCLAKSFFVQVQHQLKVATISVVFHGQVEEFSIQLDELLDNLCSEATVNTISAAMLALQTLDIRLASIDKLYDDLSSEGHGFLDRLISANKDTGHVTDFRGQNNANDSIGGENSAKDFLPGILHVKRLLIDVNDRKQRCDQLSDVRRLKLQQSLQLYTSENDVEQATDWLRELFDIMTLQYNKSCSNIEEILTVKRDHQKLEHTARSTYEYGRQLIQVSLVLRRTLRQDIIKNNQLTNHLEEIWSEFCRALSERFTRLNLTQSFFISLKQMNVKLENLFAHLSQGQENLNLAEEKRLSVSRQIFFDELRELKCVGKSLIERIDTPLVSTFENEPRTVLRGDKKTVEEIEFNLSEMNERARFLSELI